MTARIQRDPPLWFRKGNCRGADPQLFFPPDGGEPDSLREEREGHARSICSACTIRVECLAYALTSSERFGIWGGLTEDERARLRKLPTGAREGILADLADDHVPTAFHAVSL